MWLLRVAAWPFKPAILLEILFYPSSKNTPLSQTVMSLMKLIEIDRCLLTFGGSLTTKVPKFNSGRRDPWTWFDVLFPERRRRLTENK